MHALTPAEPISFTGAFELIADDLRVVEEAIREQANAFDEEIEEYMGYICGSGGKRLRPALALLSAGATGGAKSSHRDLAVIVELIHVATLVHDDIMDGADIRRDQPTANAKWGNALTVLLGDVLFAHALRLSTHFDDAAISRRIADAATEVCSGEVIQTRHRFDVELTASAYYRIIEMKTAALFSAACELGAALNDADPTTVAALKAFGAKLGIAYQIYDDILDLAGSEAETGKTLGTDLRKGKFTLPILLLLQSRKDSPALQEILTGDGEAAQNLLAEFLEKSGAVREAGTVAFRLLDEADEALASLPDSPSTRGLAAIAAHLRALLRKF